MSFIETLKSGEIPNKAKKSKTTRYDDFMASKTLKLADKSKNVVIVRPEGFQDVQKLIDKLKQRQGVIADFSRASNSAQRMIDFLSGAVYALDGKIERIENKMYLMTPKGIDILNKL
ncbi:MAG: cell division protein SepF [Firmicutes bacterium]|nr:cell division protein SepF [Bacillota bacterium]